MDLQGNNFFTEEKVNHRLFALLGLLLSFSTPAFAAAPIRDWNFLVFINGVNNLDIFGKMNINQMEEVGSDDRLNILVQWGSMNRRSVDRLLVKKDSDTRNVTSPVVQSLGLVDMGDWRQLVDFARWAQENYPARHTFIAVWNHGTGWHYVRNVGLKDISLDDRTGNSISTEQLGQAMREISANLGRKVDVYASDACLMGMIEVADEMADSVETFVGSQDLEPGQGWPYSTFLRAWTADMSRSSADVARLLSEKYLEAYSAGGIYDESEVTMSAFDLTKIDGYRRAIEALTVDLLKQPAALPGLKSALSSTKHFFETDYRDLIDFMNQARIDAVSPVPAAMVRAAHSDFVIANHQNQDAKTFGLSIWLPDDSTQFSGYWNRYRGLSFHRRTGWGTLIESMLK